MSIATKLTRSIWIPPTDGSEVLYIPFWHPTYGSNPATYISKDKNAISCTRTGGTWGKYGLTVDGNDKIDVAANTSLNLTGSMTLSAWLKPTTGANMMVIAKDSGGAGDRGWYLYIIDTGASRLYLSNDGTASIFFDTTATLTTDVWVLLTGVYDAGATTMAIYFDAINQAGTQTGTIPSSQYNASTAVDIFQRPDAFGPYNGICGGVRVYSRALSAVEILRMYQRTKWRYIS